MEVLYLRQPVQLQCKGNVKGVPVDKTSINYNTSANTSIDISKRLKFQRDINYVSAMVTSQGRDAHFMLSNAGLKYAVPKSKGVVGLQLNNIFNTNIQTVTTKRSDFYSSADYIKYDRVLQLSPGFRINESNKK